MTTKHIPDTSHVDHGPLSGWHTTKQVATELGVTTGRVRQLARELNIGRWVGSVRLFTDDDLAALRARNQTPGPIPTRGARNEQ